MGIAAIAPATSTASRSQESSDDGGYYMDHPDYGFDGSTPRFQHQAKAGARAGDWTLIMGTAVATMALPAAAALLVGRKAGLALLVASPALAAGSIAGAWTGNVAAAGVTALRDGVKLENTDASLNAEIATRGALVGTTTGILSGALTGGVALAIANAKQTPGAMKAVAVGAAAVAGAAGGALFGVQDGERSAYRAMVDVLPKHSHEGSWRYNDSLEE